MNALALILCLGAVTAPSPNFAPDDRRVLAEIGRHAPAPPVNADARAVVPAPTTKGNR